MNDSWKINRDFAYLSARKYLLLADKYVFIPYTMSSEQTKEALVEELERLKKENEQLRKELLTLKQKKGEDSPVSFKEKYAVKLSLIHI